MDRAKKWPDEARAVHVGEVTACFRMHWRFESRRSSRNKAILWNWQRREEAAGTYFTGD